MLGDKSNLFPGNRSTNSALGYGIYYLGTDLYRKVLPDWYRIHTYDTAGKRTLQVLVLQRMGNTLNLLYTESPVTTMLFISARYRF